MGKKAVIAMSGGVDSSVAALLMLKNGYDCRGVTMLLHGGENTADAEKVCQRLDMPFSVLDFKSDFEKYVINDFVSCYENGKTPNPCVECNRELKFGRLMEVTKNAGGDFLVTGHYAKTAFDENSGRYLLKKAEDSQKDQSYFLYMLTQEQLSRVVFPLGEFTRYGVSPRKTALSTPQKRTARIFALFRAAITRRLLRSIPKSAFRRAFSPIKTGMSWVSIRA